MRLLLIQGANMEYLGRRQPELYGTTTAKELDAALRRHAKGLGVDLEILYTNTEGEAVSAIYRADRDKIDGVLFNPAGMSQLSGTNISFGAAVLDIDAEAKTSSINATGAIGQPVDGGNYRNGGDIADPAVLPNFYMAHEINDSIDVGFGIHAPYGLAADYEDDFAGRFFADKTELTAIAFTPSVAVNNGQGLSMGLGLILFMQKVV